MDIVQKFGRGFLLLVMASLLSFWFMAATMQMTFLNRQIAAGWLQSSGIYHNLVNVIDFNLDPSQTFIEREDVQAALAATFPPSYLQPATETILNSTYDWIEGKKPVIEFSIDVGAKSKDFQANFAKQLEPKVAKLKRCKSTVSSNCLPIGMTAKQYSKQIANIIDDRGEPWLKEPITHNSFPAGQFDQLSWLPQVYGIFNAALYIVPAIVALAAAGAVFLHDSRLRGMIIVGRRVFFQSLLVLVIGGLLWYFGQSLSLASAAEDTDPTSQAILVNIIDPLLKKAVPDLGAAAAMLAGSVAAISGGLWFLGYMLQRRHQPPHETGRFGQPEADHEPSPLR